MIICILQWYARSHLDNRMRLSSRTLWRLVGSTANINPFDSSESDGADVDVLSTT